MSKKQRPINSNQLILNIALSIISILIIVPFILLVSVSFSSEADVSKYGRAYIDIINEKRNKQ